MAAARWTSHPQVIGTCPVCGADLPPITVDIDARSDGGSVLALEVQAQVLDGPWWDAAERAHPDCGMPRARQRYGPLS